MKRETANKINYILDNWAPPKIRDSRLLMGIAFRVILGKKYSYYMTFKQRVGEMSEKDINVYYEILSDTFIKRETDLNEQCIAFILNNIVGNRVLDAGAGRGYLVNLLYRKLRGRGYIGAVDIVLPKKRMSYIHWQQASLTSLPYKDNAFETVICAHVLEHVKDCGSAVRELRRICAKRLIIIVPRQREYQYTFDLHIHFFPYEYSLRRLIGSKNVQIMEVGHDWVCVEDFETE